MGYNILFISHLYPHKEDPAEGAVIHRQALALRARGHQVTIIAPRPISPRPLTLLSDKWARIYRIPRSYTWEGIEVHSPRYLTLPRKLLSSTRGTYMSRSIEKLLKRVTKKTYDLIHVHHGYPDGTAALDLGAKMKTPVATTFRGSDIDITLHQDEAHSRHILHVCRQSDALITPSPQLRKKLLDYEGYDSVHIGNGIYPEDRYTGEPERKPGPVILSVSRLLTQKGLDKNILALKELAPRYPEITYEIIGDGPARHIHKELVKSEGLEKHVRFLGTLPKAEVMKAMASATVFSLPSEQETFGLVYLEAMIHGTPAICCAGQGVDGIIKEKETGMLVESGDTAALVSALDFLLSNPDLAREIGNRGRETVMQNYTWERIGEQLEDLYETIIAKRPPGS
ncbi:hypothetical protein CR205_15920 [Alteribacter lacisalsi]|uniref:Glycosyltransferase family 4 protein n=1 Tax=Alteribacter lacisalsi TaxID=2045244 RepID=A0A2W0HQL4_9BACI|nr:glycosyltransferase [Alteribacter lacisalsi]PYZ95868.1 hypothetical protein CR205_15920 [Alteribacter lacisalsi]